MSCCQRTSGSGPGGNAPVAGGVCAAEILETSLGALQLVDLEELGAEIAFVFVAEALFNQSLEIARRQESKTFELRAAPSLALRHSLSTRRRGDRRRSKRGRDPHPTIFA